MIVAEESRQNKLRKFIPTFKKGTTIKLGKGKQ